VYSIEAANINRETLMAMEKAGKAMADIHGNLNIDKVDETMYVGVNKHKIWGKDTYTLCVGRNYVNSTLWAKKLPMLSQARRWANLSTKLTWRMN
jgi:hypothetical protein